MNFNRLGAAGATLALALTAGCGETAPKEDPVIKINSTAHVDGHTEATTGFIAKDHAEFLFKFDGSRVESLDITCEGDAPYTTGWNYVLDVPHQYSHSKSNTPLVCYNGVFTNVGIRQLKAIRFHLQ